MKTINLCYFAGESTAPAPAITAEAGSAPAAPGVGTREAFESESAHQPAPAASEGADKGSAQEQTDYKQFKEQFKDLYQADLQRVIDKRFKNAKKVEAERDALKKQNEELLAAYEKAKGREKRELGTELETRYDLSKVFDRSMSAIQRGEFQTAVETLTPVISDRDVKGGPLAYAFYLRGRAYYGMHRATEALSDFNDAERITPGDAAYPVWRAKQYRGLIYYDWRRYDDAVRELEAAYDASDRQDAAIADDLAKARRAAELQRHPAPAKQPSGSTKGVDWTKVITDIIIHSIHPITYTYND